MKYKTKKIKYCLHCKNKNLKEIFKLGNLFVSNFVKKKDIDKGIKPREEISCEIKYKDGSSKTIKVLCRIDTKNEVEYYKNGGILQYVLRNMIN